jgi:hypothetical protein
MRDPRSTLRYLGFRALPGGTRRLDFSFCGPDAFTRQQITVDAPNDLFSGPERMAVQECAAICYETLKCRVIGCLETLPPSISLTLADVSQHRKHHKPVGSR